MASHQSSPRLSLLWVPQLVPQQTLPVAHTHKCAQSALDWQGTEREREEEIDLEEGKGVVVWDENMGKESEGWDKGIPLAVVIDSGVYGRIV